MITVSALMSSLSFLAADDPRSIAEIDSAETRQRKLEALTRGLASEFPLHCMSQLRRAIAAAEEDLRPRNDPTDVVDRARERLREGQIA